MRQPRTAKLHGMPVALLTVAMLLASAGTASAVDRLVETSGTNTGDCSSAPCATIAYATTQAVSGDRVVIGTGTFTQTASINPGAKSIEYVGAGTSNTIVTGANATNFPSAGLFQFRTAGPTVAIRDLQITGFPGVAATGARYGIWVQPNPATSTAQINATIDNVRFVGLSSPPGGVNECALYAANNNGSLTFEDSTVEDVMGNMLLLENQAGAATITRSTFTRSVAGGSTVIFDMLHQQGAVAFNQSGLHQFTDNEIQAGAGGITIVGGFTGTNTLAANAFLVGVTIGDNAIDTGGSAGAAITMTNAANDDVGTSGEIRNAQINSNTIVSGSNNGAGIVLQGGIPNPVVVGNNIRNRTNGISLTRRTQTASPNTTWAHRPSGAQVSGNQIVDNTTGVFTDPAVSIIANLDSNWWGCNAGPDIAPSPAPGPCDTVSSASGDDLTLDRWIVLDIDATPFSELAVAGTADITAGFSKLNTGADATSIFDDGTILDMSATGGTLDTSTPPMLSSVATNTFTSTGAIGRCATASFDNQAVTHCWNDHTNAPEVTITAPSNDAVTTDSSVVVHYTVSGSGPVVCNIADGDSVPLDFGSNTITVSCEDDLDRTGTDTVTVTRKSVVYPIVTITSPANGTVTAAETVTLNFTVVADVPTTCSYANGESVPLDPGANSITVECSDEFGKSGFDSISVIRDNVSPVVTIASPLNGSIITASNVVLNYTATDPFGVASCNVPDGATVPLSVGVNTITVTCVDFAGNVGSASVTVNHPDVLPACAADVVITNVVRSGSQTKINGIARLRYAGQKVKLQYQPSGSKTIAQPIIQPDGTWRAVVTRPSKPSYTSNQARYRAILGRSSTAWIKLTRRMGAVAISSVGGEKIDVRGSVSRPLAKGQPARIERSDACGNYRQIASLKVFGSGSFGGTIADGGPSDFAVFVRVKARVQSSSGKRFNTYSIVQPLIIRR